MNPWDALGWTLLSLLWSGIAIFALTILYTSYRYFKVWARNRYRHFKTRNIPPAAGQVWDQEGQHLTIERIYKDSGRIAIRTGWAGAGSSWSDSPEDWRTRVRNRRLFLVREPTQELEP